MKTPTARSFRTLSFAVFVLVIFFWAFFDNSKHIPFLAAVNPFADDPYDAVGSFGIQLSFFAALLSLIRAFRPYATKEIPSPQLLLILRGEAVALLSILVTLTADTIAMLRYSSMWKNSSAGWMLAGLIGGLVLLAAAVGLWLHRTVINSSLFVVNRSWIRAVLFPINLLILTVYPAVLLGSIPGGIFTALAGMIILFISTWALSTTIFLQNAMNYEDFIDDFGSIYRKIKAQIPFISRLEIGTKIHWLQRLFSWLNPRHHKWNLIVLIAFLLGGLLMFAEALNEGVSTNANMILLILAIFIGMEGAGVVLGYILFRKFLGLFREESN